MSRHRPWLDSETPPNVRHIEGLGWQVLLEASNQWRTCRGELDACFIASGMRMTGAVVRGEAFGEEVAGELDAVAAIAELNFGPGGSLEICSAARLARGRA